MRTETKGCGWCGTDNRGGEPLDVASDVRRVTARRHVIAGLQRHEEAGVAELRESAPHHIAKPLSVRRGDV